MSKEHTGRVTMTTLAVVIGTTGAFLNLLCLLFYIRYPSSSLGRRLLTVLCVADLCMCTTSAVTELTEALVFFNVIEKVDILTGAYLVMSSLVMVCYESTTFLTVTLSCTRTMSFFLPTVKHKGRLLASAVIAFHVQVVARETAFVLLTWVTEYKGVNNELLREIHGRLDQICQMITFAVTVLGVLLVLALTVVCVLRLQCATSKMRATTKNNRRATITVTIVSTLFCVLNLSYTTCGGLELVLGDGPKWCIPISILFPVFNSMVNPVVFIVRNTRMRAYFWDFVIRPVICQVRRCNSGNT